MHDSVHDNVRNACSIGLLMHGGLEEGPEPDDEFDIMSIYTSLRAARLSCHWLHGTLLALDHFLKNSQQYWLVVSDIGMQLMDGYQFIKKVKEIKHDVKVFFMSAYLSDDIQFITGPVLVKVDEYIEKPISLDDFMRLVKKYFPSIFGPLQAIHLNIAKAYLYANKVPTMHIVRVLCVDNIEGFTIKTWNLESTSYKFPNH